MKKIVMLLIAVAAFAATASAQKFAFIDQEYILKKIPNYEMANEQLNQISQRWQREVETLEKEADTMYKNYQADMVFLTDEQKKKKEAEIVAKEKEASQLKYKYFGPQGEPAHLARGVALRRFCGSHYALAARLCPARGCMAQWYLLRLEPRTECLFLRQSCHKACRRSTQLAPVTPRRGGSPAEPERKPRTGKPTYMATIHLWHSPLSASAAQTLVAQPLFSRPAPHLARISLASSHGAAHALTQSLRPLASVRLVPETSRHRLSRPDKNARTDGLRAQFLLSDDFRLSLLAV